jgi:thiamine biosynthesis protein ThiI
MKRLIFIRYSELTLKGKNRNEFAKVLYKNLVKQLDGLTFESKRKYDRIEVVPLEEDITEYIKRIKKVIGVS